MSTLVARSLAAGHGDRTLFSGLDLVVAPGDVVGLVGANGAGKSTLLRILAGLTPPESGELVRAPPRRPSATCRRSRSAVPARRCWTSWPVVPAWPPRTQPSTSPATRSGPARTSTAAADDAYASRLDRWLALGGADLDDRAEVVAADLGLGVDLDRR